MEKTKLGISVGLMGAAVCLLCLFGGYVAALLLVGYILLREEDRWLRRTALKAVATLFGFSLVIGLIGLIPDGFVLLNQIAVIFDGHCDFDVIYQIFTFIELALSMAKAVLFIVMGLKALKQADVRIPLIDTLLDRHMN